MSVLQTIKSNGARDSFALTSPSIAPLGRRFYARNGLEHLIPQAYEDYIQSSGDHVAFRVLLNSEGVQRP